MIDWLVWVKFVDMGYPFLWVLPMKSETPGHTKCHSKCKADWVHRVLLSLSPHSDIQTVLVITSRLWRSQHSVVQRSVDTNYYHWWLDLGVAQWRRNFLTSQMNMSDLPTWKMFSAMVTELVTSFFTGNVTLPIAFTSQIVLPELCSWPTCIPMGTICTSSWNFWNRVMYGIGT